MRKITIAIVVIIVAVVLINLLLLFNLYPEHSDRHALYVKTYEDLFKFSIQLVVIVIGGGILIGEYNRSRQRKLDYRKLRNDTHKSLVDAYLKTKKIRWSYRVDCKNNVIDLKVYKEGLSRIMDVKTQLELIIHDIEGNEKAYMNIKSPLLSNLGNMEKFTKDLYKEYYDVPLDLVGPDKINTSNLVKLNEFIGKSPVKAGAHAGQLNQDRPTSESPFTEHYRSYLYASLKLLRSNEAEHNNQ